MNDLEPLDPAYVSDILSRHPFVNIQGVINVRDLGLYPSTTVPGHVTRPRLVLRSAELSSITDEGELIRNTLTYERATAIQGNPG